MTHFKNEDVYKLNAIVMKLNKIADTVLFDTLGITYGKFLILMTIYEHQNHKQQTICERMDLSKSVVSKRIKELMNKGLIVKKSNPSSKRESLIDLSEKGLETLQSSYRLLIEQSQKVLTPYVTSEFSMTLDTLMNALHTPINTARSTR